MLLQEKRDYILVISQDVVGGKMAGPGIRYYNLAKVLSQEFEVVLAVPCEVTPAMQGKTLQMVQYTRREWNTVEQWLDAARVVIIHSVIAGEFPQIAEKNVPVVIDGYDPLLIEWLVLSQYNLQEQEAHWDLHMYDLNRQYLLGDFFVCASERQRDWWLGLLEANGRINPWTWREDSSLRRLVDVVPYGLPLAQPYHLAGDGYVSRLEWARKILELDPHRDEQVCKEILPALTSDFPAPAQRPLFSALDCDNFAATFGLRLPAWEAALRMAMERTG